VKLKNTFYVKNMDSGREMRGLVSSDADEPKYFVLNPERDPAALAALLTYAQHCEDELSLDIRDWVDSIRVLASKGELKLGSSGAINARKLLIKRAESLEGEVKQHTLEYAEKLTSGSSWPKLSFLLEQVFPED